MIVEPEEGFLACGMTGPGRLAEPDRSPTPSSNVARAIWKAKPSSLPPALRRSRSIRSATFPTDPAAKWATRWPRRLRRAAPG